jgi:asparagine synthase (glutamine-hydrolysing)
MCGIAGFYGLRDDVLVAAMSCAMAHRGPDGEGFYIDDQVSLANRRLAIIGRASGDQPIYNEDQSIVVVYNGEIYNYQQLRAELEEAGHIFKTTTDTEVIVHAYEQWGTASFDRFNGMFALALYDKQRQQLLLARDHFGIKPLYYALLPGGKLVFASEIKPILNSKLIEKKPNDRIIYRYLAFRVHDDGEETFFEGINRLMPGEMMIVSPQGIEKSYYSTLKEDLLALAATGTGKTLQPEEVEAFREKLVEAIKMRLVSEVPVGTCLSGGMDSSSVVAVVNKLLEEKAGEALPVGERQNSFSAVFPGSSNDEERYIDALLAQHEAIQDWKIYPRPEEFLHDFEDFVRTQEEPVTSTGPYAQYKVMQEAAKHVTVLLDGQGADEMMAGYLPYYFVYLRQLLRQKRYLKLLRESMQSRDVIGKYMLDKFLKATGRRKAMSIRPLLNEEFRQRFAGERFDIVQDNIKKRLVEDIFHNSLPCLLRYEDKNGMRFSLEGRVPFLDFNTVRYLFSLSDEAIIEDGWNKNILRRAMKPLLPDVIEKRRNKIGFTTPEHEWFMRLRSELFTIFMSESFASRPYFNRRKVLEAYQEFSEGNSDETMLFWRMLNVEMWLRVFFDETSEGQNKQTRAQQNGHEHVFVPPNPGKTVEIQLNDRMYARFPLHTEVFQKGDNIEEKTQRHVQQFFVELPQSAAPVSRWYQEQPWFLVITEKVVAIAQGRSYFLCDIKPGFFAKLLSRAVKRTAAGIGLGSPWTMELAIREVGLPRILCAASVAAVTRPLGMRGWFYRVAGWKASAIDGPTEHSLYPSNVSAKLGPKDPDKVVRQVHTYLDKTLPEAYARNFQGAVIIDSNDLGRQVLGNSTPLSNKEIEEIFRDNPMGQCDEQTPLTIVFPLEQALSFAGRIEEGITESTGKSLDEAGF